MHMCWSHVIFKNGDQRWWCWCWCWPQIWKWLMNHWNSETVKQDRLPGETDACLLTTQQLLFLCYAATPRPPSDLKRAVRTVSAGADPNNCPASVNKCLSSSDPRLDTLIHIDDTDIISDILCSILEAQSNIQCSRLVKSFSQSISLY